MSSPDLSNAELLEQIYSCKWLLPREKRVFELKYREGFKNYEIAMREEPPFFPCSKETITRDLKKVYRKIEPLIIKYYDTFS